MKYVMRKSICRMHSEHVTVICEFDFGKYQRKGKKKTQKVKDRMIMLGKS